MTQREQFLKTAGIEKVETDSLNTLNQIGDLGQSHFKDINENDMEASKSKLVMSQKPNSACFMLSDTPFSKNSIENNPS